MNFPKPAWRWLTSLACSLPMLLISACAAPETAPQAPASKPGPPAEGKWVQVDKSQQKLRAYENGQLFLETRVSTGKEGAPKRGLYHAGIKDRVHFSRLYHNAPMPYAVQLEGNFFIHGYSSVPNYPASHGCVRVPMTKDNPAKRFFEWVEPGTPIEVVGSWVPRKRKQ